MGECICNTCRNLKGVIGADGEISEYACKFGFPSQRCETCDEEACDEVCRHYAEDMEEKETQVVMCKGCGTQLEKMVEDEADGDIYCFNCYIKNLDR
ncbi:MAG: hypothetical protein N2645_21960 [Clostridia bacterium]|nr:hypothetical protein [Clostridia bacterium]